MTSSRNRVGYSVTSPRGGESDDLGKTKAPKWKSAKKKSTEAKRASKAVHDKRQELRLQEVAELDFYGE